MFIDIFLNSNLLDIHKKFEDYLPMTEKYDFKPNIIFPKLLQENTC